MSSIWQTIPTSPRLGGIGSSPSGTFSAGAVSAGWVTPKQNGGSPGRRGALARTSKATTHRGCTRLSATVSSGDLQPGYLNSITRLFVIPGMTETHPWTASSAPWPCGVPVASCMTRSRAAVSSSRPGGGPCHGLEDDDDDARTHRDTARRGWTIRRERSKRSTWGRVTAPIARPHIAGAAILMTTGRIAKSRYPYFDHVSTSSHPVSRTAIPHARGSIPR